ncbi:MAG: 3-isopropylmalate dehydratase small subunit [Deltaproteobacteria bacterium]|nr:MAG: 3-isopropylmalate dehydratase small subunit [Deltaproteobacteria bacterium]
MNGGEVKVKLIKGKVWKFGDNVDTDIISPSIYMDSPEELREHAFEAIKPEFAGEVKSGDIIVGGRNFGCGSSRESAPEVIKALGVGAVVAESFGRIFFRNAIAIGLPIITCPRVSEVFEEGDELEIDLKGAKVRNISKGKEIQSEPLYHDVLDIILKGGIISLLKGMQKNE